VNLRIECDTLEGEAGESFGCNINDPGHEEAGGGELLYELKEGDISGRYGFQDLRPEFNSEIFRGTDEGLRERGVELVHEDVNASSGVAGANLCPCKGLGYCH